MRNNYKNMSNYKKMNQMQIKKGWSCVTNILAYLQNDFPRNKLIVIMLLNFGPANKAL